MNLHEAMEIVLPKYILVSPEMEMRETLESPGEGIPTIEGTIE